MQQALRHQRDKAPQVFDIMAENPDGTVDLGKDGVTVITRCKVASEPTPGTCTRIEPKPEPEPNSLSKLTKEELLAKAAAEGVEVDPKLTKAEIIAALEAKKPD